MPKPKPCPCCGNQFTKIRPLQVVCSPKCAIQYNSNKEVKKRTKQMKEEVSLPLLKKAARVWFQKWIRQRDKDQPCISCGTMDAKWDAGHFYKAELYSGLLLHEDNVHKQCSYCNSYLAGNLIAYEDGLKKRIGIDRLNNLKSLADQSRSYRWTREELQQIITTYKLKLKHQ